MLSPSPLQNPFWDRIQTVRERELHTLWRSFLVAAINSFLLNAIPTFVSVTTFTVYVLLGNELTAAKAFTSLSLFSVRQSLSVVSNDAFLLQISGQPAAAQHGCSEAICCITESSQ